MRSIGWGTMQWWTMPTSILYTMLGPTTPLQVGHLDHLSSHLYILWVLLCNHHGHHLLHGVVCTKLFSLQSVQMPICRRWCVDLHPSCPLYVEGEIPLWHRVRAWSKQQRWGRGPTSTQGSSKETASSSWWISVPISSPSANCCIYCNRYITGHLDHQGDRLLLFHI